MYCSSSPGCWSRTAPGGSRPSGADFLPAFDEGTVQVNVTLPAGSSIEASNQTAAIADRVLKRFVKSPENPNGEILTFGRRTGRSENDEHADPPSDSQFFVTINPDSGKSRAEILKLSQDAIRAEVVGADVEVEQPLAHLINHLVSGSDRAGRDQGLRRRRRHAGEDRQRRSRAAAASVPGVSSLAVEQIAVVDEIHIRLRPADLAFYGLSRDYVGQFVETALQGASGVAGRRGSAALRPRRAARRAVPHRRRQSRPPPSRTARQ